MRVHAAPLLSLLHGPPGQISVCASQAWCRLPLDLVVSHPTVPEWDGVIAAVVMNVGGVDTPDLVLTDIQCQHPRTRGEWRVELEIDKGPGQITGDVGRA